jgi:hypothetical protein
MRKILNRPNLAIALLAVGVILSLVIGVFLTIFIVRINHLASETHQLKAGAYESCLRGNTDKAGDLKRWSSIVELFGPSTDGSKLQQFVNHVNVINQTTDKPSVCVKP